jgi:iron complex outermembrane receptor protein
MFAAGLEENNKMITRKTGVEPACSLGVAAIVPLFLACAAFSASLTATAAAAAEDNRVAIEEIVVTARRKEESVQNVPIAVTALTTELQSSSIRDLTDLNGYAPNVVVQEDGSRGGGGGNILIRGISPTRSDDNSFDAPIAVVVDDIYLGTLAGQVLENFDLERIEILRGPQGTLFGKNTVGGVINIIRSRPTKELGGRFKLTGGNDGQRELRAVFNVGIGDDVGLKLFGTTINYDGHRKNATTGNNVADRDYYHVGGTVLWEPADNFELVFTAETYDDEGTLDAFHTNYNTVPGLLPAPPPGSPENDLSGGFVTCLVFGTCRESLDTPSESENDKDNEFSLGTDAYTLKMVLDINENMSLSSITGYRDVTEYRSFDFDASAAPFITIERFNEYDQFSQELRLNGNWDNVSLTTGLYYFNSEFEQDWITGDSFWHFIFGTFVPGVSTAADPFWWDFCVNGGIGAVTCDPALTSVPLSENVTQILYETQETTSYAGYIEADWRFAESWILTGGLRYTREKKEFVAGQAYLTNVERQRLRAFPGGYAELENTWTETSPKVALTFEINDNSMVYASYSQGFHSGGFFGVNQNIADFERDQYDPEFAKSWEVGYKSQHWNNRLQLNATYFRNDFEDKQESFVAFDPTTNTVASVFDNAAEVLYQGVELEVQVVFNQYLRAFLNYGYLDAEYKEFETDLNPNDGVEIIEDATHLNPRNAPEHTFGIGGTVSIPAGNGAFELFGRYSYIDEVDSDLLNLEQAKISTRNDLAATAGYYAQNWSVSIFGRNLTDERHETFFPIDNLFAAGSVNRPRSYGMEVGFEF